MLVPAYTMDRRSTVPRTRRGTSRAVLYCIPLLPPHPAYAFRPPIDDVPMDVGADDDDDDAGEALGAMVHVHVNAHNNERVMRAAEMIVRKAKRSVRKTTEVLSTIKHGALLGDTMAMHMWTLQSVSRLFAEANAHADPDTVLHNVCTLRDVWVTETEKNNLEIFTMMTREDHIMLSSVVRIIDRTLNHLENVLRDMCVRTEDHGLREVARVEESLREFRESAARWVNVVHGV